MKWSGRVIREVQDGMGGWHWDWEMGGDDGGGIIPTSTTVWVWEGATVAAVANLI